MTVAIMAEGTHWKDAIDRSKRRSANSGYDPIPMFLCAHHIDRKRKFPYNYVYIEIDPKTCSYAIHNNDLLCRKITGLDEAGINAQLIKWDLSQNGWIAYGEFKPEDVSGWQEAAQKESSVAFYEDIDNEDAALRYISIERKKEGYTIMFNIWMRNSLGRRDNISAEEVTAMLIAWGADPYNGWHS